MPTDITVTELKETVTVTGGTTSITVTGDTATVTVATTSQPVSVVEENATFTINTIANKSDVGLGNVDDTSDANKPVSTATQSALDAKLNKSGGTMTGSLTLASDPATNLQAATKQYVDNNVNAVPVINTTDDVAEGSINLYYTATRVNSAFDTRLATKSTTNLAEGSNLYHTTARARNSISATGSINYNNSTGVISYTGGANPVTTDELPEGTANKYYTDARVNTAFDTRLATKTTSNLNEGTNLYYTSARANTDFDTRLATKATTNLAEGTNLYYTSARANSDFDTRLATKSTTNLAEGTNLYHTTARARAAVSGSTGITYTEGTGAIAVDSTIATKTYADGAAASAAAALVDASPATLDTLNELAAALGDDPNFATTVSTALGNKLNTADFGTTFAGQLAGKSTTDVAEGSNLYYTDTRARAAISATGSLSYNSTTGAMSYTQPSYATVASTGAYSDLTGKPTLFSGVYADLTSKPTLFDGAYSSLTGSPTAVSSFTNDANYITTAGARSALSAGTGVAYNSSTGAISIGQAVGTTDNPTFGTVTAKLANNTYVLGALEATTNATFTFPTPALSTTTNNNGLDVASSMPASTDGNGAQQQIIHYYGDTRAGNNTTSALNMKAATGNSVTGGSVPFTGVAQVAAGAVAVNNVMGVVNFNGYATTGWSELIASQNQGGGLNTNHALQVQGIAAEAFADGTLTVVPTAVTRTAAANLSNVQVSGTKGQITFNSQATPSIGNAMLVTGTNTGTSTGIVAGTYYIIAVTGTTGCTLSATPGGVPITTTPGTTDNLTFARRFITVTYSALTNIPFGLNAKITIAGITGVADGTYMAMGTSTTTSVNIGVVTDSVALGATPTLTCPTVTNMGSGLRVRAMPLGVPGHSGNRVELVNHNASAAKYRSDSFVIASAAYGTTGSDRLTVDSTGTIITATNGQNLTNTRNYVHGAVRNATTRDTNGDIWELNTSAAQGVANPYFRGVSIDNSADTTRGPATLLRSYSGGATNGSAQRGRIIFEKARGTAAAPTAVQSADLLGSVDATGYTSTGWLNDTIPAVGGFFGFAAAENWVSNTNLGTSFTLSLAPTNIPITSGANLIQVFSLTPQSATHRSDEHSFQQGKTGTAQYLNINANRANFSVPVAYPNLTTTQRDALTPGAGWVLFNTTTAKLECYDGTAWNALF